MLLLSLRCLCRPKTTADRPLMTSFPVCLYIVAVVLLCSCVTSTLHVVRSESGSSTREYCNMELFEAHCLPDEVILMETAMYGRMKVGHCAILEYGPIGCGVDVLAVADARCSGRRRCSVPMPDHDMHVLSNCPSQVASHLEASYTCIHVDDDYEIKCAAGNPIILTSDSGYIANHVSASSSSSAPSGSGVRGQPAASPAVVPPGTSTASATAPSCYWQVRVAPGQRINLTLLDFGRHRPLGGVASAAGGTPPHHHVTAVCTKYAVVRDVGTVSGQQQQRSGSQVAVPPPPPEEKIICSGAVRERIVFSSETNAVDVRTLSARDEQFHSKVNVHPGTGVDGFRFLIRYEAVGCADLSIGGNVIVRRDGHLAMTVSCDNSSTSVRHHLVCRDRKWTGELPHCPDPHQAGHTEPAVDWWSSLTNDWTYAILTTVGLGVALGVVVGVSLLLATLAYCKRRGRYVDNNRSSLSVDKYYSSPGTVHHLQQQQQQQQQASIDELRFYYDTRRSLSSVLHDDKRSCRVTTAASVPCGGPCSGGGGGFKETLIPQPPAGHRSPAAVHGQFTATTTPDYATGLTFVGGSGCCGDDVDAAVRDDDVMTACSCACAASDRLVAYSGGFPGDRLTQQQPQQQQQQPPRGVQVFVRPYDAISS